MEHVHRERAQAAVLAEALDANPTRRVPLRESLRKPGDAMALRGLPAIARGVSGASPGTQPELALLREEARRERFAVA